VVVPARALALVKVTVLPAALRATLEKLLALWLRVTARRSLR